MTKLYTVALLMFLMTAGVLKAQTSITSIDQTYSQDFNTLADTGTATKEFNLANWQISTPTYRVNDGNVNTGTVYSFGSSESTDRALGAIVSSSTSNIYWGTSFVNKAGAPLGNIEVSYVGEQWRRSDKRVTSSQEPLADTLVFEYSLNASGVNDQTATWTPVANLNFTSPFLSTETAVLNGNEAQYRTSKSGTLNVNIATDATLFIRWSYIRRTGGITGSRDGLAIDDLTLKFKEGGEVPVDPCDFDAELDVEVEVADYTRTSFYTEFISIKEASGYVILLDANADEEGYEYGYLEDGVTYTVGQKINESLVIGIIQGNIFEYAGLAEDTYYEVYIQPYYICEGVISYGGPNGGFDFDTYEKFPCETPSEFYPKTISVEVMGNTAQVTYAAVEEAIGYIVFIDDADLADEEGDDYEWGFPEDGAAYTTGQSLGQSTIAYVGANTSVTLESLEENKRYYISVHPIFECDRVLTYGNFAEDEFTTSVSTGIRRNSISGISIYPNPVSGNVLNIKLDASAQGKANVQIFNVLGAQVYSSQQSVSSNTQLRLPNSLPAGRYTLRIEQSGGAQIGSFIVVR